MASDNPTPRPPRNPESLMDKLIKFSEGMVTVANNIYRTTLKLLGPFLIIQAIFYPKETKAWVKEYWPKWDEILKDHKEPEKKLEPEETTSYKEVKVRSEKSLKNEKKAKSVSHKTNKNKVAKSDKVDNKNRTQSEIEIFEVDGQQHRFRKFEIDKNTTKHLAIPDSLEFEEVDKSEFTLTGIQAKARRLGVKFWTYHRVLPGDSLMAVSQKYGVSKHSIMKANCRIRSVSRRGEYLIIPYPANIYRKAEE